MHEKPEMQSNGGVVDNAETVPIARMMVTLNVDVHSADSTE